MDAILHQYISEYLKMVDCACTDLLHHFSLRTKVELLEYRIQNHIWEVETERFHFRFHGCGCYAEGKEFSVNWDFEGVESRWCGIDPGFISEAIEENSFSDAERYTYNFVKTMCDIAVVNGEMEKRGACYYFTVPDNEKEQPTFPKDYDTLIIGQFNQEWVIERNKLIDKFIRKANWIHKQLYFNPFNYMLSFYKDGQEIYSIPYNDTCYPKNAVLIMSNEIIRHLKEKNRKVKVESQI